MHLPAFIVRSVGADCCSGTYEPSKWIAEGWLGCLIVSANRFVWGRFLDVDDQKHTARFRPKDVADVPLLSGAKAVHYLDGYWGERAELVLDQGRVWNRQEFEPADAVVFSRPAGGDYARELLPGESVADLPGARVALDEWDHEHCAICWEKIGRHWQAYGYTDGGEWVCERCYDEYISKRSLSFIG